MIHYIIADEQIQRANTHYEFDALNGSITHGNSNIYGALGEICVYDFFMNMGFNVDFNSTYDYDLVIEDHTIDVKTKKTTVVPMDDYLCSVAAFNIKQQCDYYLFVRVHENLTDCYLLGCKKKEDFFSEATFNSKGESDVNGWRFKADCYNLKISNLTQF